MKEKVENVDREENVTKTAVNKETRRIRHGILEYGKFNFASTFNTL